MSDFYDELAADADDLIQEFGADATLVRVIPGVYDPSTGASDSVDTSIVCRACVFDFPMHLIDGTLIRQGDQRALVSVVGLSMVPQALDQFVWQGVTCAVVRVTEIAPSGQAVLYELQIRSG